MAERTVGVPGEPERMARKVVASELLSVDGVVDGFEDLFVTIRLRLWRMEA